MLIHIRWNVVAALVIAAVLTAATAFTLPSLRGTADEAPPKTEQGTAADELKIVPILMYHSVCVNKKVDSAYYITPEKLESDLRYLQEQGYSAVFISEIADYAEGQGDLPEKPVALTFDDGYYNWATNVLPLLEKYENLLIVQTFSKSRSMAGMRIGFAIGSEKLIRYMNDVKFSVNSYTMNHLTLLCGAKTLEDDAYFRETTARIIATREEAKQRLSTLGFTFPDSYSNFIFAKHETADAGRIFEELKTRRIFVRYWNKPRISQHLRITVGTPEEMERLYAALTEILAGEGNA